MSKSNYIPYVYWIKNITTGYKYIGVKYGKRNTHPNLFWKTYFTSSNNVHKLIDLYGQDDFKIKILKTFDNKYDALTYENKLNRLAFRRVDYLNLHYNFIAEDETEESFLFKEAKHKKIASIVGTLSHLNSTGIHKLSKEEKIAIASMGGKAAAIINKELGQAIFDPSVRERQHETLREKGVSAYYDPELRFDISSAGGANGLFSKSYRERNGISDDEFIKLQSARGKIGGVMNKGSRFYTDGVNTYKYMASDQERLSFDDFLKQNPTFRKGRTLGVK